MATKTAKLIRPKSATDANYEQYEYLLAWFGPKGNLYQYLFTDREVDYSIDAEPINVTDPDTLSSLIAGEEKEVTIVAEDVSKNDFAVLLTIFKSPVVYRIYKDGANERVAVTSNSKSYRNSNQRYNLEFTVRLPQSKLYE